MPEVLDLNKFILSCIIFVLTDVIVWFQLNGYRISDYLNKHQVIFVCLLAIPIALGYFYAWKFAFDGLGSWWSCRLLGFGLSFLVYPILTHALLHESMFRPKILTCILLSVVIVMAQVFWPEKENEQRRSRYQNEDVRVSDRHDSS